MRLQRRRAVSPEISPRASHRGERPLAARLRIFWRSVCGVHGRCDTDDANKKQNRAENAELDSLDAVGASQIVATFPQVAHLMPPRRDNVASRMVSTSWEQLRFRRGNAFLKSEVDTWLRVYPDTSQTCANLNSSKEFARAIRNRFTSSYSLASARYTPRRCPFSTIPRTPRKWRRKRF